MSFVILYTLLIMIPYFTIPYILLQRAGLNLVRASSFIVYKKFTKFRAGFAFERCVIEDITLAVANLYLRKQVIFERLG